MSGTHATRARRRFPTAELLTLAAIGVAGGILLVPANWLSTALSAIGPFASIPLAGLWLLPATIALRLLRRPLAGILTGLISGIAIMPFSGFGFTSIITNVEWALMAEAGFLIVLWRFWRTWQHYAGAVLCGIAYPLAAGGYLGLWTMTPLAQVAFFLVACAACIAGTALGVLIADRLARTGVAASARRRGQSA